MYQVDYLSCGGRFHGRIPSAEVRSARKVVMGELPRSLVNEMGPDNQSAPRYDLDGHTGKQ
jgi:hypothetical protein